MKWSWKGCSWGEGIFEFNVLNLFSYNCYCVCFFGGREGILRLFFVIRGEKIVSFDFAVILFLSFYCFG